MKNLTELQGKLVIIAATKFHEQYPEIFVKPNTKDVDEHRTAYEGYGLYVKYLNAFNSLSGLPRYSVDGYAFATGKDNAEKLIKDMENTDDILKFCFLNIPLPF